MPSKHERAKSFSVNIAEHIYRRFKAAAALRGLSVADATEEALEQWAAKNMQQHEVKQGE